MANEPLRRTSARPAAPPSDRPKIWAEGKQRPPFTFRGLRRATLYLSRDAVAPLNAWAARTTRRVSVNVAGGAGRIPEGKLGRAERFVPSHLRVAAWIKNVAAVLSHASAVADLDTKRGNALVAEIEPHIWPLVTAEPSVATPDGLLDTTPEPEASPFGADAPANEPVVLVEPVQPDASSPEPDPLAAIRDDLAGTSSPAPKVRTARARAPSGPALPPEPPGPLATNAIQVSGYLVGWATVIVALPYGFVRSIWLWTAKNVDLRRIGQDD